VSDKKIKGFVFSGQMAARLQAVNFSKAKNQNVVKDRKEKAVNKYTRKDKRSSFKGCGLMLLLFWEWVEAGPVP